MSVLASAIITRIRDVLVDSAGTRWPDAELLRWMSDGQRTIVAAVPAASATRATVLLAAGTLQTLPADGYSLLSIDRNNGAAGGTIPGRAVRVVTRALLDSFNPDWHSATQKAVVVNYTYDPATPLVYFVSPPNTGAGYLDILYSKLPTDLAATSTAIGIDPIYQTALMDYVLYKAYSKDADFAPGMALAAGYLQTFNAALGMVETGRLSESPNLDMAPTDMSARGTAK